jgi:hypothetical protein
LLSRLQAQGILPASPVDDELEAMRKEMEAEKKDKPPPAA